MDQPRQSYDCVWWRYSHTLLIYPSHTLLIEHTYASTQSTTHIPLCLPLPPPLTAMSNGTPCDDYCNDLYTFDVNTHTWLGLLPFDEELPPLQPRAETQAACYKGGAVYIFGGYTTRELGGYRYYDDGIRIAHRKEGKLRWTRIKPFKSSSSSSSSSGGGGGGGGGQAATTSSAATVGLNPSGRAGRWSLDLLNCRRLLT